MGAERSSNSSFLDSFNSTSSNTTQLAGSDFKDPVLVSAIVVNGICTFSFAFLAIAAHGIKGKKERGRKSFGVLAGLLGAMFLLVSPSSLAFCGTVLKNYNLHTTSSFVDATGIGIANELESTISYVSTVLGLVKNTIDNGTDISLIFVIYNVITNRFRNVRRNHDGNTSLRYMHFGIAAITALLGLADAAVGDYAQTITTTDGADSDNSVNLANLYRKIHLTYTTVYCVVTLEMLACAVFIFKQSKLTGTESRVSKAQKE
jgi:hypothetical protein